MMMRGYLVIESLVGTLPIDVTPTTTDGYSKSQLSVPGTSLMRLKVPDPFVIFTIAVGADLPLVLLGPRVPVTCIRATS